MRFHRDLEPAAVGEVKEQRFARVQGGLRGAEDREALPDLQRVEDHPFIDTDNTGVKEARERGCGVPIHHAFIQDRVAADIFSRFVEMEERPVVRGGRTGFGNGGGFFVKKVIALLCKT